MAVFDILPGNFFSVLVSPNREIYVEALLLLHQMFQFELNIKIKFLIEDTIQRGAHHIEKNKDSSHCWFYAKRII